MTSCEPPRATDDVTTSSGRLYDVVVPVKRLDVAKSRLVDLGDDLRRDLVVAFLLDTLDAVVASPAVARVAVVTDDPVVVSAVSDLGFLARGVAIVADTASGGLNPALHRGVAALRTRRPPSPYGVLALCADLPGLTTTAVSDLLGMAPEGRAGFVADRAATGTTAYVTHDVRHFDPRFGPGSRAAHLAQGSKELSGVVGEAIRCDVDVREDLDHVGVRAGRWTTQVLARHEYSPLLG